ncbi:hypothetical protein DFH06DRAFT_1119116 [Mycena polygramma]|nr:hypothetical protein DFH06DRAFT_1119116 [Mycena polygramma]
MAQSSNLREANFQLEGSWEPFIPPSSMLQLNRLQSLALEVCEDMDHHLMPVLNCLTIPALKSLTLEFPYPHILPTSIHVSPFRSFISRSPFQIHTLSLEYLPTMVTSLIACLQATPSLVHLKLRPAPHLANMSAVFGQLTGVADFLPKLEGFHTYLPLNRDAEWYPTVSVVARMLCWRWAAVGITRLRSFRLWYGDGLEIDAIKSHPECHRLRAEGMKLYFGKDQLEIPS